MTPTNPDYADNHTTTLVSVQNASGQARQVEILHRTITIPISCIYDDDILSATRLEIGLLLKHYRQSGIRCDLTYRLVNLVATKVYPKHMVEQFSIPHFVALLSLTKNNAKNPPEWAGFQWF